MQISSPTSWTLSMSEMWETIQFGIQFTPAYALCSRKGWKWLSPEVCLVPGHLHEDICTANPHGTVSWYPREEGSFLWHLWKNVHHGDMYSSTCWAGPFPRQDVLSVRMCHGICFGCGMGDAFGDVWLSKNGNIYIQSINRIRQLISNKIRDTFCHKIL